SSGRASEKPRPPQQLRKRTRTRSRQHMPPKSRAGAKKVRRKETKNVAHGHAHIKSTFNNTIVSITDPNGAVISWASSGHVGFKGSRKSTPYAAQMAAESAARKAQEHGMKKVDVFVKGPRSGRETAIRSLQAAGLEVGKIRDVTPQPHNGCRPPKRRRVGGSRGGVRHHGPLPRTRHSQVASAQGRPDRRCQGLRAAT